MVGEGWQVRVALLLSSDDAVLLARRSGRELWEVPEASLPPGEDPEVRVRTVAKEQLGLDLPWVELVWAEVRKAGEASTLVLHYSGEASDYPQPGEGWAEVRFFQVEHLPPLSEEDRQAIYRTLTGG